MPRRRRYLLGGHAYHVVNRGAKRALMFRAAQDYLAFEELLQEHVSAPDARVALFAYCLMPNHWHMVVSPGADLALSSFMHRLTTAHARAWQYANGTKGQGAVYQGRFAAIPIQSDRHFLIVCRYVERNALRASLVGRAEDWPWSSLCRRAHEGEVPWLAPWPVDRAPTWIDDVNQAQTLGELDAIRRAIRRGLPFGDDVWTQSVGGGASRRPRRLQRD